MFKWPKFIGQIFGDILENKAFYNYIGQYKRAI